MDEREPTVSASLAGTGAPPWAAVILAEVQAARRAQVEQAKRLEAIADQFDDLAATVQGGRAGEASHDEQLRALNNRVSHIEALIKWAAGIGTALLVAVGTAWATLAGGPRPPAAH